MIILIEFLVIVILSLIIKGYVREHHVLNEALEKQYSETSFKKAEHTDVILQLANAIVEKLSQEMYQGTFKKNKIVKDVCSRFYRELQNKCK
jgi:hypothetical protein